MQSKGNVTRLKVDNRCVESRVRVDTFVGGCYRLNMEEKRGGGGSPEKYLDEYRRKPRFERQTEAQRMFWAEFASWN